MAKRPSLLKRSAYAWYRVIQTVHCECQLQRCP